MLEEWRTVPSLPAYEASSLGRIRRVPHVKAMPKGGVRTYGGKPWTGTWCEDQLRYTFMFKGKTYRVARVVCEAFHGPPPFKGAVAMHLNEKSDDNTPENLAWGTQKENLNAPGFIRYCARRAGWRHPLYVDPVDKL